MMLFMKMKKIFFGIGITLIIIIGGFVIWGYTPPDPMNEALDAMRSDENITVSSDSWIEFKKNDIVPQKAIIIYPGGRIDPRSYAPTAKSLAMAGFLVIIASMPLSLAVFAANKADKIISDHPEIEIWAIGGLS